MVCIACPEVVAPSTVLTDHEGVGKNGACDMAQRAKMSAAKPDDLSAMPGVGGVSTVGENRLPQVVF